MPDQRPKNDQGLASAIQPLSPQNPGAFGDTGEGSTPFGGSPASTALGGILAGANIFADPGGQGEAGLRNRSKQGLFNFLGQGGGVNNARTIAQNEFDLDRHKVGGFGDFQPGVAEAMVGRGPGGGLGVFSDIDQFSADNQPTLEDTSPGLLQKILGIVNAVSGVASAGAGAGGGGG